MKSFNLGDKVSFGGVIGYIVAIEIDVFTIDEIPYQMNNLIYTVRCFNDWSERGYCDFKRIESDLKKEEK